MTDYKRTQQLYKLLNLFKKNNKREPLSKTFYVLWVVLLGGLNLSIYDFLIYAVANIHIEQINTILICLSFSMILLGLLISFISGIIMIFIYCRKYIKLKRYKQINFSSTACKDTYQIERYTNILQKYFTQPFLEKKLLELDFQIRTKNARLIPFIITGGFIASIFAFIIGKISILQIVDIFNFIMFSPKSIQHLAIQNITMIVSSFFLGMFLGVIAVKLQTYKYTYWSDIIKLTIQLMEHEKKYKTIQVNSNIDHSNNSAKWKQKIVTWFQK